MTLFTINHSHGREEVCSADSGCTVERRETFVDRVETQVANIAYWLGCRLDLPDPHRHVPDPIVDSNGNPCNQNGVDMHDSCFGSSLRSMVYDAGELIRKVRSTHRNRFEDQFEPEA